MSGLLSYGKTSEVLSAGKIYVRNHLRNSASEDYKEKWAYYGTLRYSPLDCFNASLSNLNIPLL